MKRRKLEKHLKARGWWLHREGANHAIWTNGKDKIPVPRHSEIREGTARAILKQASMEFGE